MMVKFVHDDLQSLHEIISRHKYNYYFHRQIPAIYLRSTQHTRLHYHRLSQHHTRSDNTEHGEHAGEDMTSAALGKNRRNGRSGWHSVSSGVCGRGRHRGARGDVRRLGWGEDCRNGVVAGLLRGVSGDNRGLLGGVGGGDGVGGHGAHRGVRGGLGGLDVAGAAGDGGLDGSASTAAVEEGEGRSGGDDREDGVEELHCDCCFEVWFLCVERVDNGEV